MSLGLQMLMPLHMVAVCRYSGLVQLANFFDFGYCSILFVFDKYCPIMN